MNNTLEYHRNHGQTVVTGESSVVNTGILAIHLADPLSDETVVTVKWGETDAVYHYSVSSDQWDEALADALAKGSLGTLANRIKNSAWSCRREDGGEARHWGSLVTAYRNRGRSIAAQAA